MTANVWANVGGISQALPMDTLLGTPDQLLGMNAGGTAGRWKAVKFNDAANQLWNVDGSTAAPAYSFTSATGYGAYLKTANTFAVAIAGADKFLVTSTGINSTAIGATTPSTGAFSSLTNSGDFTTTAGKFDGTVAVAGNIGLIIRAPAGGDVFRVAPNSAGNGTTLSASNSASSDFTPLTLQGNGITIASRTGVGTVGTSAVFTSTGVSVPGQVVTPIVDSGVAAALVLKTNNGVSQVLINHVASAVNLPVLSGAITGARVPIGVGGSSADANAGMNISTRGSGALLLMSLDFGSNSLEIDPPAGGGSSTVWVTIRGGNAVNPQIGSTGGLDITPASVRFTGVGTTANAANATLNAVGSNDILRSTSSKFFKQLLGDVTLLESRHIILNSKPVRYTSKSVSDDPNVEHIGFTAEQIRDVDPRMVTYDEFNIPNWVQYPNFVVPLCVMAQDHEARLAALEKAAGIALTTTVAPISIQ